MTRCRKTALSYDDLQVAARDVVDSIETRTCAACGGVVYVMVREFGGTRVDLQSHVPMVTTLRPMSVQVAS